MVLFHDRWIGHDHDMTWHLSLMGRNRTWCSLARSTDPYGLLILLFPLMNCGAVFGMPTNCLDQSGSGANALGPHFGAPRLDFRRK